MPAHWQTRALFPVGCNLRTKPACVARVEPRRIKAHLNTCAQISTCVEVHADILIGGICRASTSHSVMMSAWQCVAGSSTKQAVRGMHVYIRLMLNELQDCGRPRLIRHHGKDETLCDGMRLQSRTKQACKVVNTYMCKGPCDHGSMAYRPEAKKARRPVSMCSSTRRHPPTKDCTSPHLHSVIGLPHLGMCCLKTDTPHTEGPDTHCI